MSGDKLWGADLKLVKAASLVVAGLQHFLLACRPLLVDLTLVAELLGQVVQTLQSAHSQQHTLSNPKVKGDRRRGVGGVQEEGMGAGPGLSVPNTHHNQRNFFSKCIVLKEIHILCLKLLKLVTVF